MQSGSNESAGVSGMKTGSNESAGVNSDGFVNVTSKDGVEAVIVEDEFAPVSADEGEGAGTEKKSFEFQDYGFLAFDSGRLDGATALGEFYLGRADLQAHPDTCGVDLSDPKIKK